MSAPTIDPALLFAALLLSPVPLPVAVEYAVRTPIDSWDGRPSWLTLADSVSQDRAVAERHFQPGDVLVSGPAGTALHTWGAVR
jgi:hypothetical protein